MVDQTPDERAASAADALYARDAASQQLGITVDVSVAGAATAQMSVTKGMLNGHAVCHGGHIFALADTAFAFACNGYGTVTVAAGATIDFLRPGKLGDRLTATAEERHRGKRSGVYDVTVRDQNGAEIATFRGRSHDTQHPHEPPSAA
ncbi:MAG: hydroxyphenylacetyl-CoA thioesterase PaaI [Pseudomonadota bacterium]